MPTPTRQVRYNTRRCVLTCPECGDERHVSQRHHNAVKNGTHKATCQACRWTPNVRVTDSYKRYWTTRYTHQEIVEMAAGLELLLGDHSRAAQERLRSRG